MRIALLGPLTVLLDDGTPVEVRGQRVRALAALLALQAGRTVTSARLIDGVWGEDPPAKAANALQTLVKRLRATCGAAMVLARTGGYCLAVAPGDVDAHRFTARVDQVRRMDAERCDERALASAVDQLAEALQMWSGPEALPGLRDFPGVASAATRLDEVRLGAVELLADHRLRLGRASESISLLTSEAEAQPLRESLTARLMTALAAAGRRSEALTVFHRARTMLAAELGVVPSGELRAAHRRILGRDASSAGGVGDASTGLPTGLPTNLPRAHSSFVGREAEGARISTLLEAAALVTLTGPGGTGKTRLAVETATRIAGGYADGVWLVELGAVTDPARVGGAVLTALGIRDDRDGESTGEVAEALSGRQLLLVIDNCEHLLAAVAQVVHEIVVRCPRVKVLATSREPLDLPGEHLVPVPALSLPPVGADPRQALESAAVRLFLDRATQARPDFRLTEADCAAVCTICRELDGLPLALELAATRMRAMSPADLAAGLADRFELLAAGRRAADPRHHSLRAVVAWSSWG